MKIDYANELNEEQLRVVQEGDGPTLVLAGAGSGKTRTIIYRVAWLLEHGVDPGSILLVTFTNKAAREMKERLEQLLGSSVTGIWAGTFHSIANRILRTEAYRLGYEPNYTILDQDDSKSLIKLCIKELKIDKGKRRFPSPAVLQGMISYSRNASIPVSEAVEKRGSSFVELIPDIEAVARLYKDKKMESNCMDFDDLLIEFHRLLAENTDVENRLAKKFEYILVDEYQDTNTLQANIVARLAKEHRNVFVVGDDAQSIYSFRAADIRNILRFPEIYNDAKTYRLETNYRSTPQILNLANESIAFNQDQFEKNLRPNRSDGSRPALTSHRSPRWEAMYIADLLTSRLQDDVDASEIAVLFRAAYQSQALEFELMKRGIRYDYRGGVRFFERAHIKDATAFQRIIENPRDAASWMRILGMVPGVGPATAQKIIVVVQEYSFNEWMHDDILGSLPKKAAEGWSQAREMLRRILEADSIAGQIRALLSTMYIEHAEHAYTNAADRFTDIEQLALFSEGYEERGKFLEDVTLSDEFGTSSNSKFEKLPVLSTIHQSKGLEWDTVFVMGLNDGAFPNHRSLEEDGALEEERRLFYVAVTRAKRKLHLTYPSTGLGKGYQGLLPSLFVSEITTGVIEQPSSLRSSLESGQDSRYDRYDQGGFHDDGPTIVLNDAPHRERTSSGFLKDY